MFEKIYPPTFERVKLHTSKSVNKKIQKQTLENVKYFIDKDKNAISQRIKKLDKEWDTERVLEANAALIILISTILGFTISRWWFVFLGFIAFFLFQHAVQGWCPPLPIIRRLGIRTATEIDEEKVALKMIRKDFEGFKNEPENICQHARLNE
ncbi:MAG: hypothetical protein VR72_21625 [Clostridiaceae bacterium BRH_c20a]|nr:MAG: hypothetical protein VR72_21625 [Clostridiaceae bacterium BRH_c20a]